MAIPTHIRLQFVTPERALAAEDVDEVELPGEDGYFGVLPGHAPLLAALRPGEMWYRIGKEKRYAFLTGGFAKCCPIACQSYRKSRNAPKILTSRALKPPSAALKSAWRGRRATWISNARASPSFARFARLETARIAQRRN
jgi:hypothetical protein